MIAQGDIFWADLGAPTGSEPGLRRPVVIVQRDAINRSHFNTVLVVPLTTATRHAALPGNIRIPHGDGALPQTSVARATHVMVVDKSRLAEKIGALPRTRLDEILDAIAWVLGR